VIKCKCIIVARIWYITVYG